VKNVVGYVLFGHHNNTYMFEPGEPALPKCLGCGYRVDFFPHNPNYVFKKTFKPVSMEDVIISKKTTALSATYDGQWIVSKEFKKFCLQQGYKGLKFERFPEDTEHFQLIILPQVKFDVVRRETRFLNRCHVCGNYAEVIGATPAFLQVSEPLADGFYSSDLLFGSGDGKHPLIIVGMETKAKLTAAKFKGLDFEPAYGLE